MCIRDRTDFIQSSVDGPLSRCPDLADIRDGKNVDAFGDMADDRPIYLGLISQWPRPQRPIEVCHEKDGVDQARVVGQDEDALLSLFQDSGQAVHAYAVAQ